MNKHVPWPAWALAPAEATSREEQLLLPKLASSAPRRHVHLLPSLSLGGAERIVVDLMADYTAGGIEADVIVLRDGLSEHPTPALRGITFHRIGHLPWPERIAYAAGIIRSTNLPAYSHILSVDEMKRLIGFGCQLVPVFHNVAEGWRLEMPSWMVDRQKVPFIAACGELVGHQLREVLPAEGPPVRVLRHIVPPPFAEWERATLRRKLRQALGIPDETLLVGMLGRFCRQKNYRLAVQVLQAIRARGQEARMVIFGSSRGADGVESQVAVRAEAIVRGMTPHILMPGPCAEARRVLAGFDLFLNTSLYEGVSIATMEACAAGIPVLGSDVGGQREAILFAQKGLARLLPLETPAEKWASHALELVSALDAPSLNHAVPDWVRATAAANWGWSLEVGAGRTRQDAQGLGVLFVTANLDVGGAQRSLSNLAAELGPQGISDGIHIAVSGPVGVQDYLSHALSGGAPVSLMNRDGEVPSLAERCGQVLRLVRELRPRWLAFWNMDAESKLVIQKALQGGPVQLCDVSPGPMLFDELGRAGSIATAMATSPEGYLKDLDLLVSKYHPPEMPLGVQQVAVVPNGVPAPLPLPPDEGIFPPPGYDPRLAVVTVGRLVSAKRPDLLPILARRLARELPGSSITVVGGFHEGPPDQGWLDFEAACGPDGLPPNLFLAGPHGNASGFLHRFAAFYMVSTSQGCPNASLEAMACGLPVVANPDGGTAEQVIHGQTGFLVADTGERDSYAAALAHHLANLLREPEEARQMGLKGQAHVRQRFSMPAMAARYAALFNNRMPLEADQ